jgi:hypothetical protein
MPRCGPGRGRRERSGQDRGRPGPMRTETGPRNGGTGAGRHPRRRCGRSAVMAVDLGNISSCPLGVRCESCGVERDDLAVCTGRVRRLGVACLTCARAAPDLGSCRRSRSARGAARWSALRPPRQHGRGDGRSGGRRPVSANAAQPFPFRAFAAGGRRPACCSIRATGAVELRRFSVARRGRRCDTFGRTGDPGWPER